MKNDESWPQVLEEKKTKIKSISQAVTALDALGIFFKLPSGIFCYYYQLI